MVHVLEETQRLLKSSGCLIDIQPLIEAPRLEVYQGNNVILSEPDPNYDYEDDLRQAESSITQVIERGLFDIERRSDFDFLTHGSSALELYALWTKAGGDNNHEKDSGERLKKEVYVRAEEIRQAAGEDAQVALHERARILRLSPKLEKEEST